MKHFYCPRGKLCRYVCYLSLFFLLLWAWRPAQGQVLQPLSVGDTVPELVIENILHYKTPNAKLSDFKEKPLILNFWASWCATCISMIPKMDSLQKELDTQVRFLSVTYQSEKEISSFMAKYAQRHPERIARPEVVGDRILRQLFPHTYVPHYVWLDSNRIVRAFTGMDQINIQKIREFIEGQQAPEEQKSDPVPLAYDHQKPLLIDRNGGDGQNLLYHSLLTSYTSGLRGGFQIKMGGQADQRISVTNCSRLWLYRIAYENKNSFFSERDVLLEVKSPEKLTSPLAGSRYRKWLEDGNGFCYELIAPSHLASQFKQMMQRDLSVLFPQYQATVTSRPDTCLVLNKIKNVALAAQTGKSSVTLLPNGWSMQNSNLAKLVNQLNGVGRLPYTLFDQTEIDTPLDMDVLSASWEVGDLNQALSSYGLELQYQIRQRPQLIIRDQPPSQ